MIFDSEKYKTLRVIETMSHAREIREMLTAD